MTSIFDFAYPVDEEGMDLAAYVAAQSSAEEAALDAPAELAAAPGADLDGPTGLDGPAAAPATAPAAALDNPAAAGAAPGAVLGQFKQDMIVLTSRLQADGESLPLIDRVVRGLEQYVKDSGITGEQADELEADLLDEPCADVGKKGGKAPRKPSRRTKRNSQATVEIPDLVVDGIPTNVVVRFQDYTTDANHRRSNFRNQVTLRHGVTSGPTLKIFRNGSLQGAGWKSVAAFVRYVDEAAEHLGLPALDPAATKLSLVNGSARIQRVPPGGLPMAQFRDDMAARGHTISWDPSTGNNGAKVKIPDDVTGLERSAMVFSNGYVKMFALSEEQLVRVYGRLNSILGEMLSPPAP